jgi:hypothetical protein
VLLEALKKCAVETAMERIQISGIRSRHRVAGGGKHRLRSRVSFGGVFRTFWTTYCRVHAGTEKVAMPPRGHLPTLRALDFTPKADAVVFRSLHHYGRAGAVMRRRLIRASLGSHPEGGASCPTFRRTARAPAWAAPSSSPSGRDRQTIWEVFETDDRNLFLTPAGSMDST